MDIAPPLTSHGYGSPYAKHAAPLASPLHPHGAITCAASEQQAAAAAAAELLAIDDLLDFSDDDIGGPIDSAAASSLSVLSSELQIETPVLPSMDRQLAAHHNQSSCFDSTTLCVPCDDLAELEWLSNFVEESFSSGNEQASLAWSSFNGGLAMEADEKRACRSGDEVFRTTSPVSVLDSNASFGGGEKLSPAFSSGPAAGADDTSPAGRGRARSKRCRTAVCFWNSRILSPEPSESLLESSSATPIQAASSESNMYDTFYDYDDDEGGVDDDQDDDDQDDDAGYRRIHHHKLKHSPPLKVKKSFPSTCKMKGPSKLFNVKKPKKSKADDASSPLALPLARKCLHCGAQKTPQWRAGPMGPKTLCNACGVRFKSGRLCDEYRPAASPTFVESVHSNSHRKVLEMRKQRGVVMNGLEGQKLRADSHRLRAGECARNDAHEGNNNDCDPNHEELVSSQG